MKILALDFDGVLIDGLREVFLNAVNTYQSMTGNMFFSEEKLDFDAFEKYPGLEKYYDEYRRLYCFGQGGHFHYVIIHAIVLGGTVENEEDIDKVMKGCKDDELEKAGKLFYELREELRAKDPEKWMNLHTVFREITDKLVELPADIKPVVATAKDKKSVEVLLEHFGVGPMEILDKEYGLNKKVHMERLIQEYELSSDDICFVDDRLPVVLKAKETGVKCFIATWGSNNAKQREIAVASGIELLDLDEFLDKICKVLY